MLTDLRSRFITHLKALHPDFKDINAHPGRLDVDEIKSISARTPAARVGVWGSIATEATADGQIIIRPGFAIAIIAKATHLLSAHDVAMRLASDVATGLGTFVPGAANIDTEQDILPGVGLVENISMDISDTKELNAKGIALWGVLCHVPIRAGMSLARAEAHRDIVVEYPDGFDAADFET